MNTGLPPEVLVTIQWPQRIIESLGREPKVGDWALRDSDPRQIATQDELDELRESLDPADVGDWITGIWATKEEALKHT